MFTPVITSQRAQDHLGMVKGHYADIIRGMTDQSQRVSVYNQQVAAGDMEKQQLRSEENQNVALNKQKQDELEIKRLALSLP